jgi:hypothetical protein
MFKSSAKAALMCAVFPIGLLASGCTGMGVGGVGNAGLHEVVAGNWTAAKTDFNEDYRNQPEHPIAVFNMGTAYHHDGDVDKADAMFSEAVQRGKGFQPDITLEPEGHPDATLPAAASLTVAEHACNRLHRDNKLDVNCGDSIVAIEMPPAPTPAPVAEAVPEPAPAIEAEATAVPPKQDRN